MSLSDYRQSGGKADPRLKSVGKLVDGLQSGGGRADFVQAIGRMIGTNQPSFECIRQADADFQSASSAEDVWGAALSMAACLRGANMLPDDPDPPETPPPPPPPPPFPPDGRGDALDVVLAALLVRLHDQA